MYNIRLKDVGTIIFDFDETLVASIQSALITANYTYNFELTRDDLYRVRKWNFEDVIPQLNRNQVENIFASEMFFNTLIPYKSMIEAMKWFKEQGKKIVILSLGTPMNLCHKSKWIKDNLSGLYDYLILAGSENNLKMDKSIFNYGKGCALIDDNVSNLKTTSCEYKIMSKLYTSEPTEWSEGWQGFSISSGEELINMFY